MPEALNSVAAFHKLFHCPILSEPTIPDAKRCALRVSLICEELNEFEEAIKEVRASFCMCVCVLVVCS